MERMETVQISHPGCVPLRGEAGVQCSRRLHSASLALVCRSGDSGGAGSWGMQLQSLAVEGARQLDEHKLFQRLITLLIIYSSFPASNCLASNWIVLDLSLLD